MAQQEKQTDEPNDTLLATYLQKQFYAEHFADSCYAGIHLLEISFSSRSVSTFISGNVNAVYKTRIEKLLADPLKIWDEHYVAYFKKNNVHIVLPLLFVINSNCTSEKFLNAKDTIISADLFDRAVINEVALKMVVSQSLSLKRSFNQLRLQQKGKAINCIMAAPCTISSRPNMRKIMM